MHPRAGWGRAMGKFLQKSALQVETGIWQVIDGNQLSAYDCNSYTWHFVAKMM